MNLKRKFNIVKKITTFAVAAAICLGGLGGATEVRAENDLEVIESLDGNLSQEDGVTDGKSDVDSGENSSSDENVEKAIPTVLLEVNEKIQLSISEDLDENEGYHWLSDDTNVATVDSNGEITAISAGSAQIYVKGSKGYEEYVIVKVLSSELAEHRLAIDLKIGDSARLYISDSPNVIWRSLSTAVTVDNNGKITAVGPESGLAIVEAELNGNIQQIYIRVR